MHSFCITKTPINCDDDVRIVVIKSSSSYQGVHFEGSLNNDEFKMVGIPFSGSLIDNTQFSADDSQALNFTLSEVNKISSIEFSTWDELQSSIKNGNANKFKTPNKEHSFLNFFVIKENVYQYLLTLNSDLFFDRHINTFSDLYIKFLESFDVLNNIKQSKIFKSMQENEKDVSDETLSRFCKNNLNVFDESGVISSFCDDENCIMSLIKFMGYSDAIKSFSEIFYIEHLLNRMGLIFIPVQACNETISVDDTSDFFVNLHLKNITDKYKNDEESIPFKVKVKNIITLSDVIVSLRAWEFEEDEIKIYLKEIEDFADGSYSFKINFNHNSFKEDSFFLLLKESLPYKMNKITFIRDIN